MNTPYSGEKTHSSEIVERTDPVVTHPETHPDDFNDNVPVDATHVIEMPSGSTVAVTPKNAQFVDETRVGDTVPYKAPVAANVESSAALLNHEESEQFRTRWNEIQGTFVDEPRAAVQQADALVTEVIGQITQMFASNHSTLESQWKQGNDVSTEDLRKALKHYRSFFNRLVV
jgi:hypothetical protein